MSEHRALLKTIVHVVCACLFFLLSLSAVAAQDSEPSNANAKADQMISMLKERLHLTEDQAAKAKPIFEEFMDKGREIAENNMLDARAKRDSLLQLRWSVDMRLAQIFTDEQMSEYRRFREERMRDLAPHDGGVHGSASGNSYRNNNRVNSGLIFGF